ncbi:MAG: cysteine desulfurase family protein [Terriglobales bacterium]
MPRRVYLDNNATTPVLPEVVDAMRPYFSDRFGNASSIHSHGQQTRAAVEHARESVAALIGARASEIVFTSGGTEADNLAIFGPLQTNRLDANKSRSQKTHIITSTIEHHAVLNACRHLESTGCELTSVPVDARGLVDPSDVRRALRPNTKLISIMLANNETGVLQPVREIAAIAAEAGVLFHTDAVQAAGKIPLRVADIGCDLLTISSHKLHGPQGVGALFVKKNTPIDAMLHGGRHERSRRAGTENVPGIVGLGRAAELAQASLQRQDADRDIYKDDDDRPAADRPSADRSNADNIQSLRDRLESRLLQLDSATVNGAAAPRVPNTTNICFEGIDGEALVIALDLKGLAVSTGAACSSGAIEPSHVLIAMGLSPDRARSSIRFSLGKLTTAEDVDFALSIVPETVARLRDLSPVWKATANC